MKRKKIPLNLALPPFKIFMDYPLVKVMIKMEFAKCAPNLEHGWFGESVAKISPRWSHYIWDTSVARRQAWKSITLMHDDRRDEPPLLKTSFNATTLFMHACSTMTLKSLIQQLVDLFHCISTKNLSFLIDNIRLLKRRPAITGKTSNFLNFIAGVLSMRNINGWISFCTIRETVDPLGP